MRNSLRRERPPGTGPGHNSQHEDDHERDFGSSGLDRYPVPRLTDSPYMSSPAPFPLLSATLATTVPGGGGAPSRDHSLPPVGKARPGPSPGDVGSRQSAGLRSGANGEGGAALGSAAAQAALPGADGGLSPVVHPQLREDVRGVVAHRLLAKIKLPGDLLVARTTGDEVQDLYLA